MRNCCAESGDPLDLAHRWSAGGRRPSHRPHRPEPPAGHRFPPPPLPTSAQRVRPPPRTFLAHVARVALRCPAVRPKDMPSAPARRPWVTAWIIALRSSAVGASSARSPITYARNAACGIWVPTSTARGILSSASRYSPNVSHSHVMPSASALPGMSSTPSMSSISQSCRSGRTGANPMPQLPIMAVVTPCQQDGVRCGSQVAWPSKCVWMSTNPGVTVSPSASIVRRAVPVILPISLIRPSCTAISAVRAAAPSRPRTVRHE